MLLPPFTGSPCRADLDRSSAFKECEVLKAAAPNLAAKFLEASTAALILKVPETAQRDSSIAP
jgi:hypothetical protein